MKLTLENIGKIDNATIEINGITIIAGENNTGKSTVGKVLFCIFNSLYELKKRIDRQRKDSIEKSLGIYISPPFDFDNMDDDNVSDEDILWTMQKMIMNFSKIILQNPKSLQKETENLFIALKKYSGEEIDEKKREEALKKITEILHVSDDEIFRTILLRKLSLEFNGQITNVYFPDKEGQIDLLIKDTEIRTSLLNNDITNMPNKINLNTEVIYIDDPFILDETGGVLNYYGDISHLGHRNHLRLKLFRSSMTTSAISEIIATKKFNNILSKIDTIFRGEMVTGRLNSFVYKKNGEEATLNIQSLSTGLKTFVILKTLLKNGALEENGTIILDEPEIHLHPEWQIVFAEIIVLIQKEFNMHILINTHSPYFLQAIEVFAEKYEILEKCKFYLAENKGEISTISDVTDEPDKIYAKLAKPLQDLENIRYGDD